MKLFHFISDKYGLEALSEQRLKLSLIDDLNDPFELNAVELSNRQYREKFKKFKRDMANQFGILCFSKTWGSPLLWSHYANRHKGLALKFEVSDGIAHAIRYSKNRYILNYKKFEGCIRCDTNDIQGIWLTKYLQWKYENEVRVILRKSECYKQGDIYFYQLGKDIHIKRLILGPLCETSVQEIKNCLPENIKISIIKARLAFRSFRIVKNKDFKTLHLVGNKT